MSDDLLKNSVESDGNELLTKTELSKPQPADNNGFHSQFACDIDGVHTEFVFHRFTNKWLLLITQFNTIPNMYTVRFDIRPDQRLQSDIGHRVTVPELHSPVPITMTSNLGNNSDEVRSGIQFLVNKTALCQCPKDSFVIGLGLKTIGAKNLREIADVLNDILT